MNERGAALPVVLAVVTAVLVIGLAMGSLSTLSLQFNRRQVEGIRAEMAARSAIANVVAKLRQHDAESELNPLRPQPSNVVSLFPGEFKVVEGQHTVTVHFQTSAEGYSSDNLGGDAPSVGWPDTDEVPRVPPFGLDVILNVKGPSSEHHFRAGLKRVWPYALYAKQGPVALMSNPSGGTSGSPTTIKGDIYTYWMGEEGEGGILRTGYGYGHLNDPSKVLANLEARAGYHPQRPTNHHLLVGMPLGYNEPRGPSDVHDDSTPEEKLYFYNLDALVRKFDENEDQANFSPKVLLDIDRDNQVVGDFVYNHKELAEVPPYIHPGSSMDGRSQLARGPVLDPLAQIEAGSGAPSTTFDSAGFQDLNLPLADTTLEDAYALDFADLEYDDGDGTLPRPYLLQEDLVLTPSENSTGGPVSTHYQIDGTVSNRQVVYNKGTSGRGGGVYVREQKAGMRLQDTVLHVKGDLDLSATELEAVPEADPNAKGLEIVGAGATLIVDGQLILGNAHINAQDQGFVLYARDIVLKGGGTFFGLMIAENSITILSQDNDLEIKGALMCAGPGGITLKGTKLEHDPEYLKSINGGGDFVMVSWKKL
jgi:hypothetical protein